MGFWLQTGEFAFICNYASSLVGNLVPAKLGVFPKSIYPAVAKRGLFRDERLPYVCGINCIQRLRNRRTRACWPSRFVKVFSPLTVEIASRIPIGTNACRYRHLAH